MMNKTIYNPRTLAAPIGHFDRAVRLGDWLLISGTSALTNVQGDMHNRRLILGIEAQTHETLDNIEKVCLEAGGSLSHIYEFRIFVKEPQHFAHVSDILKQRLPEKGFIAHGYVSGLLHPEMEIEIEACAFLGKLD
ncbi:RidA family protein [SAR202 cluster bacterium AD-802-E10_MRT_200m]|nr:RidA family protein [SAR202 cluster bacterium AD-802-E10_MRT_200m]